MTVDIFKVLAPDDLRALADALEAFNEALIMDGEYTKATEFIRSADVTHPADPNRAIGRFVDTGDGWYAFEPAQYPITFSGGE